MFGWKLQQIYDKLHFSISNGSLEDLWRADAAKGGSGVSRVLSSLQVLGSITRHIRVLAEGGSGSGLCTTPLVQGGMWNAAFLKSRYGAW